MTTMSHCSCVLCLSHFLFIIVMWVFLPCSLKGGERWVCVSHYWNGIYIQCSWMLETSSAQSFCDCVIYFQMAKVHKCSLARVYANKCEGSSVQPFWFSNLRRL